MKGSMKSFALNAAIAAAFLSCGDDDNNKNNGGTGPVGQGIIQGKVLDGVTGLPIELPETSAAEGIHILVNEKTLFAQNRGRFVPEDGKSLVTGEYVVSQVPVDQVFPVSVNISGYQPFHGYVHIPSTVEANGYAHTSGQTREDGAAATPGAMIELTRPTYIANIKLYPNNVEIQDHIITVKQGGLPVENAFVRLHRNGNADFNYLQGGVDAELNGNSASVSPENLLSTSCETTCAQADPFRNNEFFILPSKISSPPIVGRTNADGEFAIKKEDLSLGEVFLVEINPTTGAKPNLSTLAIHYSDPASFAIKNEPFRKIIEIEKTNGELEIVAMSTEYEKWNLEGKMIIDFSHDIEIVPGTADLMAATLLDTAADTTLELDENVIDNARPEQLKYEIVGNKLILMPSFKSAAPKINLDPQVKIEFSNIFVRATDKTIGVPVEVSALASKHLGEPTEGEEASPSAPNPLTISFFGG